jgi:hypothetical protein
MQDKLEIFDKPTDLGFSNGWRKAPDIVQECRKAGHLPKSENAGKCLTKITCDRCGYFYTDDSSG